MKKFSYPSSLFLRLVIGYVFLFSSVISYPTLRNLENNDTEQYYDIIYNESSYFPGNPRIYDTPTTTEISLSWYRRNKLQCSKNNISIGLYSVDNIPLYTLSTINNTVTIIGMINYQKSITDYYMNASLKHLEPVILTSSDIGNTWTCVLVNSTAIITTNDIFRIGAAVVTYIYPPPPLSMSIPQVRLVTPTLTTKNISLQCNLLCIIGGLQGQPGLYDTVYTNKVTCSKDNGYTWYFTASLPTTIIRASAIQYKQELLILGGLRGDTSANILSAIWDYTTCNITGWNEYASESPVTDRFDLAVNTIWNNDTQSIELWAGGGKTMISGSSIRSVDLWRTSTPFDQLSWKLIDGLLPVSTVTIPADEGWNDFSIMTTSTNIPWLYQYGAYDANDPTQEGFYSILLFNSDVTYMYVPGFTSDWIKIKSNIVFNHNNGGMVWFPPAHRRSIFLYDDVHGGIPVTLTFDVSNGEFIRVDTNPCLDNCPDGTWTQSCRYSPYDAVCRPCSRCKKGYYANGICPKFSDTICNKCSTCNADQIILIPCNHKNNTVCGYENINYLDPNYILIKNGKLNYIYYSIIGCLILFILILLGSPILFKGQNSDGSFIIDGLNGNNDTTNLSINNNNSTTSGIDSSKNNVNIFPPVMSRSIFIRTYLSSVLSWLRVIWSFMGTLIHYICYITLTIILWKVPKLDIITSLLIFCLVIGPILNTVLLWYTTQRNININGIHIPRWKPTMYYSWLIVTISILHPRTFLNLSPGFTVNNRHLLNLEKLPYQRYQRSLYWIILSSILFEFPPAMGCLLVVGTISIPIAAPAIFICVSLTIINMFGTISWTISAYTRSGILNKFSSNYNHHHHHNPNEKVSIVNNTNISEHLNIEKKQVNPISSVLLSIHNNYPDTIVPVQRDNINLRSITKHTILSEKIENSDHNIVPPSTTIIGTGHEQTNMITPLNNRSSMPSDAHIVSSTVPNHNNSTEYRNMAVNVPLSSIQRENNNNNNLGNFFLHFGTVPTGEQHFDRVITELAPMEGGEMEEEMVVDDVLSITRTTSSSASSININHPINQDTSPSSTDIRSRSTSVSVNSESGNLPIYSSTVPILPTPFYSPISGLSTMDFLSPSPTDLQSSNSRRSRVVRSLIPNNPTNNL